MATTEVGSTLPSSRKIPPNNVEKGLDGREEGDDNECRVKQCPKCQQEVVNKSLEDHHQEDCSHPVPCKLKHAGCDFEGPRYQVEEHLKSNMLHHLTLISEFIKKEKEKREKLKLVTIGVGVIVGLIMLGGFLYLKARKASLESVKSLEGSVATNASDLQQLGKEFKDSVAKNARGIEQLREKLDTTQGSLWKTFTSYIKFWQK